MTPVLLALALVALAAWVVVLVTRPWPAQGTLLPAAGPGGPPSDAAALVPARHEAAGLPATLPRLLAQGPPLRRVVLVDDRSTDGTGDVARALAREGGAGLEVVRVEALPPGWAGKVHAQEVGLAALDAGGWTAPPDARWVWLTDADIDHPPDVVTRLLALAHAGGFDLVSVMARLGARSFWERLLVPPFVWFFHALYPFARVADPGSPVAAAAGGCILVRRAALARAGAFAAWRAAGIDDVALARAVKRSGGRLWLGLAGEVVSRRAYPTLGSLVDMVARSAFEQLRGRVLLVPVVWAALLLAFAVPPAALVVGALLGHAGLATTGLVGWTLLTAAVLPAFRHHRVPSRYALAMPLAAVLYACMTTVSAARARAGRDTPWRTAAP